MLVALLLTAALGPTRADERAQAPDLRDVIGVTHVAGKYHLTDRPFLAEGADQVLAFGSRVIKLYLMLPPERHYPFNFEWPEVQTLVDLAETAPYREVFRKPFTTYILTTYAVGRPEHYWRAGLADEQARDEQQQFYRLARHLLTRYRASGKTFVLQHWEGDWAIRGAFDPKRDPSPEAIRGMIGWLAARQRGVDRARAQAEAAGVRVFHAAEVNLVKIGLEGARPTVTNRVLPHTRLDLVSYSAWDTRSDPALLRSALDHIARHMPDRRPFGDRNVYVGEFGQPENDFPSSDVARTVRAAAETAIDWGCPYVVYWQLYCNEARRRPVAQNDDVRGFWLLRPDGTRGAAWSALHGLLDR